jgi:hypothetical protein
MQRRLALYQKLVQRYGEAVQTLLPTLGMREYWAFMTQVRIIQKSKNAMQSGRAGTDIWVLEFEPSEAKRADPLMGWAGSGDTQQQLNLKFKTLDAAKAYADKKGYQTTIVPAAPKSLKLQAYADNFR